MKRALFFGRWCCSSASNFCRLILPLTCSAAAMSSARGDADAPAEEDIFLNHSTKKNSGKIENPSEKNLKACHDIIV